jgi:hypothetical protein
LIQFLWSEHTHETEANFSIEKYGAKTAEKEECEEQLLTEYATLLGFYLVRWPFYQGLPLDRTICRENLVGLIWRCLE